MSARTIAGATTTIGIGSWLVAPLVTMARRGTVDQQTKSAIREEGVHAEAVRRAQRRQAQVNAVAAIPAPRAGGHQPRRSPVQA
jgi:hypothetical protein